MKSEASSSLISSKEGALACGCRVDCLVVGGIFEFLEPLECGLQYDELEKC